MDIQEQELIYQYVRLLNDSINTLYDANRYDTISNLSNINKISESNDPQNSDNNSLNDINITTKINSQNNSISSMSLDTNNPNNSIEIDQNTLNTTTAVNNFIGKKFYGDKNICTIKFINSNDKKEYNIKEFIKTDKVASLFDYVENLRRDMKSIQNFSNFDLAHGFPSTYLSQLKNKTLLEEGLFPLSEIYICEKKSLNKNNYLFDEIL